MSFIDPYLQADPAPPSPMEMAGQLQSLRNAAASNQLLQNENLSFQQKQAAGQIVSNALLAHTDQNGLVDYGGVQADLIKNGSGNPAVGEALGQMLSQTGQQTSNQRTNSDLAASQDANVAPTIGALPDNATSADAKTALNLAVNTGALSPARASAITGTMPDSSVDPAGFKAWKNNYFRNPALGEQAAQDVEHAPIVSVDTGNAVNLDRTPNRYDGTPGSVLQSMPIKLSAAQKAGRFGVIDPITHQPQTVSVGSVSDDSGNSLPGTAAMPTGQAPGVAEAATAAGVGSAGMLDADRLAAGGARGRIFQLKQALTGLQGAGATGPGTDQLNQVKSYMITLGQAALGRAGLSEDQVEQVKNYDEANKYLTAYAASQAGSMGAGTDAKLATAISGNASTHISGLAAQQVVKANIGLERMSQAKMNAWQAAQDQSGGVLGPADYAAWSNRWGQSTDPRAFAVDMMPAAQRKAMIDQMSPAERSQFFSTYSQAKSMGLLPGLSGQQ